MVHYCHEQYKHIEPTLGFNISASFRLAKAHNKVLGGSFTIRQIDTSIYQGPFIIIPIQMKLSIYKCYFFLSILNYKLELIPLSSKKSIFQKSLTFKQPKNIEVTLCSLWNKAMLAYKACS